MASLLVSFPIVRPRAAAFAVCDGSTATASPCRKVLSVDGDLLTDDATVIDGLCSFLRNRHRRYERMVCRIGDATPHYVLTVQIGRRYARGNDDSAHRRAGTGWADLGMMRQPDPRKPDVTAHNGLSRSVARLLQDLRLRLAPQ